jgi:hypothetical protein
MLLESRGLSFQVTNTGPREGVSQDMREGDRQAEEYGSNSYRADDIRSVCEVVIGQYWDAAIGLESDPVQNRAQDRQVINCGDVGAGAEQESDNRDNRQGLFELCLGFFAHDELSLFEFSNRPALVPFPQPSGLKKNALNDVVVTTAAIL